MPILQYELASDLTSPDIRPTCDGIKTKDMFLDGPERRLHAKRSRCCSLNRKAGFRVSSSCIGFRRTVISRPRCFLTNTETEEALSEFLAYAKDKFKGYDLFLSFPAENQLAINYLERQGFTCIEDDYNNTAYLEHLMPAVDNKGKF